MDQYFELIIRTPNGDVYVGNAESLRLSTDGGDLEVFSHHASLTGTFKYSPLVVVDGEKTEESFVIRNGVFSFDNAENKALVMALYVEKKSEVSHQTVKEYLAFVQEQLAEGKDLSDFQIKYLEGEKLAIEEQMKEVGA